MPIANEQLDRLEAGAPLSHRLVKLPGFSRAAHESPAHCRDGSTTPDAPAGAKPTAVRSSVATGLSAPLARPRAGGNRRTVEDRDRREQRPEEQGDHPGQGAVRLAERRAEGEDAPSPSVTSDQSTTQVAAANASQVRRADGVPVEPEDRADRDGREQQPEWPASDDPDRVNGSVTVTVETATQGEEREGRGSSAPVLTARTNARPYFSRVGRSFSIP